MKVIVVRESDEKVLSEEEKAIFEGKIIDCVSAYKFEFIFTKVQP